MKPSVCLLILISCARVLAAEPAGDAANVEKRLPNIGPEVLKVEKNIRDHPTDKKPEILVDAEMDGSATIRGKKVPADQLAKHLKDLEKDRTKWLIVLRGPAKLPATTIQKLLTAVGEAGYEDISFATSTKEAPDRRNDAEPSGSEGKLASGSVLRLSETDIAGAATIRGEYVVSSKGEVKLPYIGSVAVDGLTRTQAIRKIRDAWAAAGIHAK